MYCILASFSTHVKHIAVSLRIFINQHDSKYKPYVDSLSLWNNDELKPKDNSWDDWKASILLMATGY